MLLVIRKEFRMPANKFAGKYIGTDRVALCSKLEDSGNEYHYWKA